jgi:hypothetical protein
MPTDDKTMENHRIGGTGFQFSAKRIKDLGASEYTLVAIAADETGSVASFARQIEKTIQEVVKACRYSARADNLMLRTVVFNNNEDVREVHGFKPLSECDVAAYDNCLQPGGMTNLYDASYSCASSLNQYGEELSKQDYGVNGIVIVITDGDDNASKTTPNMLKDVIAQGISGEHLESCVSILVGVNVNDPTMSQRLKEFQTGAGFTQYVEIDQATDKKLARLADFVSKSISAQSSALGTGGPSKALTY